MLKAKLRVGTFPVSTQALAFTLKLRYTSLGKCLNGQKLARIRLSFTRNPRNSENCLTANSAAICNKICTVPCKRLAQCKRLLTMNQLTLLSHNSPNRTWSKVKMLNILYPIKSKQTRAIPFPGKSSEQHVEVHHQTSFEPKTEEHVYLKAISAAQRALRRKKQNIIISIGLCWELWRTSGQFATRAVIDFTER